MKSCGIRLKRFWRFGPVVAALVMSLPIYLLTLAPTITWAHHGADGGDLVTAVARGSIPHPPGFPTYLLLGDLFVRLPWRDPAWRLNLMSAVLAAGAGGVTVVAMWRLLSHSGSAASAAVTLSTGLALCLTPLLWSQALIAEVYAPAAFFAALVVTLAIRRGPSWALGLAWGIGLGVHLTLLLLAPLVVWAVWRSRRGRLLRFGLLGLLVLVGWGIAYGPILLARRDVLSPWADVSTAAGWWALVSGRLYHGYLFALPPTAWPRRLLAWAGVLMRQFTPLGGLWAGVGWVWLWRERRGFALASALAGGAFSIYAIGYSTVDSLLYLVPALPVAALWLGAGLSQVAQWLGRSAARAAWLLLLLPLLQALLFWRAMDLSGDWTAPAWAQGVLRAAPHEAVLVTNQDAHTFALWYTHHVLGERPDVVVVDQDLWGEDSYRRMVAGELQIGPRATGDSLEETANLVGRPVVRVGDPSIMEEEP